MNDYTMKFFSSRTIMLNSLPRNRGDCMTKSGLQHYFIQQSPLSGERIKLQDLVQIYSVISAYREVRSVGIRICQVLPVMKTLLSMLTPRSPDLGEGRLPTVVQC